MRWIPVTAMFGLALAARAEPVALPDTRVEHLMSKRNGVAYRLHVAVPPDFDSRTVRYPVVVMLDADYSFPVAHSITTHLRERSDLPDLLVVAIGYDGPRNYKLNRTRDYTPVNVPTGGYGPEFQRESGGAPAFVDFIEHELFPWLEQRYRAGPERVIVGHSYGGLFAIWCALARPKAFTGAIAVSPSLFYDDHLIARLEAKLDAKARASLAMKIYAASGSEENPQMPGDLTALGSAMTGARYPKLKAKFEVLDGETHNSIFPRALSNGLRFLWPRGTFTPSQAPGTRPAGG